ncbi:type I-C CRISPR-associated protein Cas5c [Ruminococcus sp.]|uniref:type I-C CRISPR-associated protein Cas5c n=1 Tax=Ruminococcus sp. TaxID=41978 RepID=UPI0025D0BE29|nr:type I-C CRISPR-associated protein Cas5c [Ruminococcus sp.]
MELKEHRNTVVFSVYGKYALFSDVITRPGKEKTTYMIPTYEALKGIMHSIYFKPTLIWYIDRVRIMNQIQTVRKGMRPLVYANMKKPDLAYYTYLADVHYQVQAHFEWNLNRPELQNDRNENKHHNIAKRMIERGGRRDIFLGTRECQGYVEPCVFGEGEGFYDNSGTVPYNLMYHGITYADEAENEEDKGFMTVRFWNPVMQDGIIDFLPPKDCTIKRQIKPMAIKAFGKEHQNFSGLDEFSEVVENELDK